MLNMMSGGVSSGLVGRGWTAIMLMAMSLGLFIQITGKVWFLSGSGRNGQIYVWLLLPALIYCLNCLIRNRFRLALSYLPWLAFLAWVALSALWATDSETSVLSLMKRGIFIALYLFAIYLLVNHAEEKFRRVLLMSIIVVAVSALASLVYQYGVLGKPWGYRAYRIDRLGFSNVANYGWPVAAGIFHGAIATWALALALDKKNGFGRVSFWFAAFAILSLYVIMTGTRGAWIALAGSSMLAVILQRPQLAKPILSISVLLMVAGAFLKWGAIVEEVGGRQFSGRGGIWAYFFDVMSGHWIIGYGVGTPFEYIWPNKISTSPHAHSLYLQQIYDSGLIALGLLCLGLFVVISRAWGMRDNPWVRLALPALLFALISMLTDVERIFTRPSDYWTVFWLPVAVLLAVRGVKQSSH